MEVKQEPRDENFEVKIKTEPLPENCYNPETYDVNDCDSFKIKREVLKIEDEEVFDLNSEPSNSSNDINIKHEEVEDEEQFEISDEMETETQDDELYSKPLNTDEKIEIFDEFFEHKDFKEEVDIFQNNKTTFESINKMEKNDMETDIQSDISMDNNLSTNEQQYSDKQIKLQCEFCDKSFARKISMDDHLLKYHQEISKSKLKSLITYKIYTCNIYSYSTTHKGNLHTHNITHSDQRLKIKCKFCDEEFVKNVSMENHLLKHHTELSETDLKGLITSKVFTCKICPYKTMHKHSLYSHNSIKHSKEQFKCNFCQKLFAQKISMDDHLLKHHPEMTESNLNSLITNKVFTCKFCSYSTTLKGNLHIHNITHNDQRLKIKCKFCDEEFVKKVSMEDHYLKHHTELSETDLKGLITSKVMRCKICSYKTTRKNCLNYHIANHGKKQFKCKYCEEVFVEKVLIDDHLLKLHPELTKSNLNNYKVHTCKICSFTTTNKRGLDMHNITHSDQRLKINCKFCDESFLKKVSLDDHLLKNHPELSKSDLKTLITYKVYTCKTCSYSTTHKGCLHSHNITHRDQQLKIKCKLCNEEFVKKASMQDHLLKHHTELSETDLKELITSKVLTCKICPYKTTHKGSLHRHKITHRDQLTTKCIFCQKVFAKKISMDDHILKHHPEVTKSSLNKLITNKLYTCKICSYSTTQKGNLHIHNITHSDQRLKIKCNFCDESFLKKVSIENHLLKHHTELSETDLKGMITSKVFACKICSYKTTYQNCLDSHMNTNHSRKQLKIKCKCCDSEFVRKASMEDHLLKHHTELSETELKGLITSQVLSCKICPYKTTHKHSLDSHINTKHVKRQRLKCKFCDELFVKQVSVDNHLLKHHTELSETDLKGLITSKVLTCKICSYKTTHKNCLDYHMNTNHRDQQLKIKCKLR